MNLVILDGTINSMIERVIDPRRTRARFVVATTHGDEIGVEVRGNGAERLFQDWSPGDGVHVRGKVTSAGYIAADLVKRTRRDLDRAEQTALGFFRLGRHPDYTASLA